MTPSQFNTKLVKHFKKECMWQINYNTQCYTVTVYKAIAAMQTIVKADSAIAFGIGSSLEKAFEDCIESLKGR